MYFIPLSLGLLIGLPMGGLGGGGGVLLFPLLVYLVGMPPKIAVVHSVVLVGCTCLFPLFIHLRDGALRLREGFILAAFGGLAAQVGALATKAASDRSILMAASALVFMVAYLMATRRKTMIGKEVAEIPLLLYVPIGFGVGFVTGFLGVGGGFLLVPVCSILGRMPIRVAAGTSLFVGAINAASGYLAHQDVPLRFEVIIPFLIASFCSSLVASHYAKRAPEALLKTIFAVFLALIGCGMLIDLLQR